MIGAIASSIKLGDQPVVSCSSWLRETFHHRLMWDQVNRWLQLFEIQVRVFQHLKTVQTRATRGIVDPSLCATVVKI